MHANDLYPQSDTEQQYMLNHMISRQAVRIDRIIQDTLNMVRNKETHPTRLNLEQFLPLFLQEDLADIQQNIRLNVQAKTLIDFDEAQFRQILINLIRNAIRHNNPDMSYIEVVARTDQKKVQIDVRDFGHGVALQNRAQLFQPFFSYWNWFRIISCS